MRRTAVVAQKRFFSSGNRLNSYKNIAVPNAPKETQKAIDYILEPFIQGPKVVTSEMPGPKAKDLLKKMNEIVDARYGIYGRLMWQVLKILFLR